LFRTLIVGAYQDEKENFLRFVVGFIFWFTAFLQYSMARPHPKFVSFRERIGKHMAGFSEQDQEKSLDMQFPAPTGEVEQLSEQLDEGCRSRHLADLTERELLAEFWGADDGFQKAI
jgi:hypothetical protein